MNNRHYYFNDSSEEIRFAIEQGADINRSYCGHFGRKSPLAVAVALTKSKAVEALLECGAKIVNWSGPSLVTSGSFTGKGIKYPSIKLTHYAMLQGDVKSALALIKAGANWSNSNFDIINQILKFYPQEKEASLELIQIIFDQDYDIKNTSWKANIWRKAIHNDHCNSVLDNELIKLFTQNGADINQLITRASGRGSPIQFTPLAIAIQNSKLQIIKLLLNNGANINKQISVNLSRKGIQQIPTFAYALHLRSKNQPNMHEIVEYLQNYQSLNNKPLPNTKLNNNQQNKPHAFISRFSHQLPEGVKLLKIKNKYPHGYQLQLKNAYIRFNGATTRAVSDQVMKTIQKYGKHISLKRNLSNLQNHMIEVETFMNQAELQKILDQVNNRI